MAVAGVRGAELAARGLLCLVCLGGCWAAAEDTDEDAWWKNAVVYQIYPRSYVDSDGDGIGDLNGIASQLSYLADLGVTGIWLTPIYPSPQKDFGYDISNYKGVDSTYGTMADFESLLAKAHKLGLKLILDMVPNHTSNQHEWFVQSEAGNASYTDYYVWAAGNTSNVNSTTGQPGVPNNWVSGFRGSAWEWSETRQMYYLHQFLPEQPDLNYRNASVVQEMKDVFTFWMEKGVDGFRMDAVFSLFEDKELRSEPLSGDTDDEDDPGYVDHIYTRDQNENFDMVTQWRSVVDGYNESSERVMMTECYSPADKLVKYYGNETNPGASFPFNFAIISNLSSSSNASVFKSAIDDYMDLLGDEDWRWPNWVSSIPDGLSSCRRVSWTQLGNHDQHRVGSRYGPDMVDAMNMISMTLPGTAITYYGEELGMVDTFVSWAQTQDPSALRNGEDQYLEISRDFQRTPMQWDNSTSSGFSSNATTWLPTNPNYWRLNVAIQQKSSTSHLSVYKDLIAARKSTTLLERDNVAVTVVGDGILRIERSLTGDATFVTLVNIGSYEETLTASELGVSSMYVYTASDNSGLTKGSSAPSSLTLRPKAGVLFCSESSSTSGASPVAGYSSSVVSIGLAVLAATLRGR